MPMNILEKLTQFYKLPYEKVLKNTTHQEFIEITIEDMVALASISEVRNGTDLDWLFMAILEIEENVDKETIVEANFEG